MSPSPVLLRTERLALRRFTADGAELAVAPLSALRGRRLGCWCVPERGHAEVITELAGSGTGDTP
ncbi:DUF4326 domain-containing protein [Streptomyces platensis]|uniref:DUF4326 domain-containing protein n=1 Tax=Streptomyces platensis TaxID=58346 RepID=UPI00379A8598